MICGPLLAYHLTYAWSHTLHLTSTSPILTKTLSGAPLSLGFSHGAELQHLACIQEGSFCLFEYKYSPHPLIYSPIFELVLLYWNFTPLSCSCHLAFHFICSWESWSNLLLQHSHIGLIKLWRILNHQEYSGCILSYEVILWFLNLLCSVE